MKFENFDTASQDSLAKFIRKMTKEGIDFSAVMQSPAKLRNLKDFAAHNFPKMNKNGKVVESALPEGEELAKLILGGDYLSVEETAKAFCFQYTDAQLEHLAQTLPTDLDTLQSIKADGCILVPGPTADTHLLGVRDLDNQPFFSKKGGWHSKNKENFAITDVAKAATWMIVRKAPVENSTSKNWSEQSKMIPKGSYVPNAAEMSYAIVDYFKVRGVRLFSNTCVRTSSVSADGERVYVGDFSSDGLHVNYYGDSHRDSLLGVASARD